MSGVEVAGLVLAVIPLVVAGIDSYSNGLRTIKKIRHCMDELEDMRDDLECEHEKFQHTVELLLSDSVDDRTLQRLFDDIGGEMWADEHVDKCLHGRLQRSYAIFWKSVKSMNKSLQELKRGLDLDVKKNPIQDRVRRIAFAFKLKDYRALVDKVQRSNGHIDNLVRRSIELLPIRALRRKYPDFEISRTCASNAHMALQASLAASCHDVHYAGVFLRSVSPRVVASQQSKSEVEEASHLTVLLRYSLASAALTALKWQDEEVEIRPLQVGVGSASRGPLQQMIRTRSQNGQLKAFRHHIGPIRDLCGSIQRLQTKVAGVCLGYLPGHPSPQNQGLHWPATRLCGESTTWERLTLAQLLAARSEPGLNELTKRRLALSLATGLMRMHDTPWIRGQWGAREVIVQRAGRMIATDHALLMAELQKNNRNKTARTDDRYFQPSALIKNEMLFALGVLLIELCLEKSFQELRSEQDFAQTVSYRELADYLIVNRLLNLVYKKAGVRYGDVVQRCVGCEFGGSSKDLNDPGFKRIVYGSVVQELEREVEDACR